ncbi:MAG TPA: cytochrome c biogenesis protein CcsA [Terriglobia bacterium]|nr:cytochrome c biogenesis protein CcsA [Terriglobia bacterium]
MKLKILAIVTLVSMIFALYMIFIFAPREATQGDAQRIFYFHVPLAILGYVGAFLLGYGSIRYLISRDSKWDRFAQASAEVAVAFTTAQLFTASMWARPIWGPWWVWDARTTMQVVLYLIFIAYLMLREFVPEGPKRAILSSVFGLLAIVDVPINYLAIYLFRTQHPQAVVSPGGGGLDPDMNKAFIASFFALTLLFVYLLNRRLAIAKIEEEVHYLEQVVMVNE